MENTMPKYQPLTPEASQYLRNLLETKNGLEKRKQDLSAARDKADEELKTVGAAEEQKREHLMSEYGEAVREIKTVNKQLRWCGREAFTAISQGDEAGLFEGDPVVTLPTFSPADEADEDDEQPVGEPD